MVHKGPPCVCVGEGARPHGMASSLTIELLLSPLSGRGREREREKERDCERYIIHEGGDLEADIDYLLWLCPFLCTYGMGCPYLDLWLLPHFFLHFIFLFLFPFFFFCLF